MTFKDKLLSREKRYLDFEYTARMFFQLNVKNNILRVNELWAYAYGFRALMPIETSIQHRPFSRRRRSVYNTLESLLDFPHNLAKNLPCFVKIFDSGFWLHSYEANVAKGNVKNLFALGGVFVLEYGQCSNQMANHIRINHKNNMLEVNEIFAYASGFRANFPIESHVNGKSRVRRELYNVITTLLDFIVITTTYSINGTNSILKRGKRYLDFLNLSRMTFRVSIRNNILQVNNVFSYSVGLRANMPIESDHLHYLDFNIHPHHPKPKTIRRRHVYETIEDLLNAHGLDGRACILKSFCTVTESIREGYGTGMLFKIFQLIFTPRDHDKRHFPYLNENNCNQLLHQHCPFGFDSISPYTDDF
ncbi:uncharacterized protein LOC129618515 [Condylostylus longicornis]|uniref:uncharacterized protein LOC129618515 n=1 Tax=Condylostylus longicornis TaxID=2530218 RepID=UPI00244E3A00|nr:uncharacterized protein LOC129618515 [Condylostylus longicornis]